MRRYGPNSSEVESIVDRSERLALSEIRRLATAFDAQGSYLVAARAEARSGAEREGRASYLDAARIDARGAVMDAVWVAVRGLADDADRATGNAAEELKHAGWDAVLEHAWQGTREFAFKAAIAASDRAIVAVLDGVLELDTSETLGAAWKASITRS